MDDVMWEVLSEKTEYVLDDNPNVHLKNAELALCERRYDDAETHAAYAESVSKEKSKSVQQQVKQQCNIVRGFVYVDKAKDLVNEKRYIEAEKYIELAGSLSRQDKKLLEKYKHIVGWLNTSLAEEAKTAFEQGYYDVAEKYIERISNNARFADITDNGKTFDFVVNKLVSVYIKKARIALSNKEYEDVRSYVDHVRSFVADNRNVAEKGFRFALAALINEYLNEARMALKEGKYEDVISHISYAQSIAEDCKEAVSKCDAMAYALADTCLDKARDALAELRFDNVSVYIGYAQSAANGKKKIIQDCTAIRAYSNLEKSKIALHEKQYNTALTGIRFTENMIERSGAASEDIRQVCNALLKKLAEAYMEEVKTALQEDRYTDAKEYAESVRLIVNRNATVMQECKKLLVELHFELAKAAMQKKLYTVVDTAMEYVQFISEQSDSVQQQCGVIRSNAFLERAKDAFSEADYEQAVSFMQKAKSASAGDANVGKQCMKILRQLKKKGYAKDIPWDVDRLRKEALLRKTKAILKTVCICLLICLGLIASIKLAPVIRERKITDKPTEYWEIDLSQIYQYLQDGSTAGEVAQDMQNLNVPYQLDSTDNGVEITFIGEWNGIYGEVAYYDREYTYNIFTWETDSLLDAEDIEEIFDLTPHPGFTEYRWKDKLDIEVSYFSSSCHLVIELCDALTTWYNTRNNDTVFDDEALSEDDEYPSEGTIPTVGTELDTIISFSDIPELEDRTFAHTGEDGTWRTEFVFGKNGDFSASFREFEEGNTGIGYPNGTVFVLDYHGCCTDLEKIDDYAYSMCAGSVEVDVPPINEEIINETRYIYLHPTGIDNSNIFYLYLSGKPTADLPEDILNLVGFTGQFESIPPTLPCWVLYNATTQMGFMG